MFDAGVDAAPVAAVDSFVNYAPDLNIHSIATQNPVIDPAQQVQQAALFSHGRIAARDAFIISPCFGFVVRDGA